jgi:predicted dehydrogenase
MDRIGVGVVGAGWMGQVHSRAYARMPHHYPDVPLRPVLVALADPAERLRLDAVDRYGFATSYAGWEELVADPAIAVVSVATPPYLHAEIAEAVARAGKHLWLEKPAGLSLDDTRRVEAAVSAAGVVARIGYNYRFVPAVVKARELITRGGIGRVTHARFRMLTDYAAHPLAPLSWRYETERGGDGVIGDLLSHGFDLVRHLLGDVDRLVADTSVLIPRRPLSTGAGSHYDVVDDGPVGPVENPDHAACLLRTVADVSVFLEGSRVGVGDQNNYGFEIRGTTGLVAWDFRRPGELVVSRGGTYANQPLTTMLAGPGDGDYDRFQPGAGISLGFDDLKVMECAGLLGAIAGGPPDDGATVGDALAVARLMDAVRTAAPPRWTDVRAP